MCDFFSFFILLICFKTKKKPRMFGWINRQMEDNRWVEQLDFTQRSTINVPDPADSSYKWNSLNGGKWYSDSKKAGFFRTRFLCPRCSGFFVISSYKFNYQPREAQSQWCIKYLTYHIVFSPFKPCRPCCYPSGPHWRDWRQCRNTNQHSHHC